MAAQQKLIAVILAAGEGKRMKSSVTKVAHRICGKALVEYVLEAAEGAGADKCIAVVGHKAQQVMDCLGSRVDYAVQETQQGTGHAVIQARKAIEKYAGDKGGNKGSNKGSDKSGDNGGNKGGDNDDILVLCGDTPLITSATLREALLHHRQTGNAVTVITAAVEDPKGYGRIIRDEDGNLTGIIEHRDATEEQKEINEINAGMYCYKRRELLDALGKLKNDNDQGEYYLTDTIMIIKNNGAKAGAYKIADGREIAGINDRIQLAGAAAILRGKILAELMAEGVTIEDPSSAYIDAGVKIGRDTVIRPGTIIEGNTVVGMECTIGPGCCITDSVIGDRCEISNSVVRECAIAPESRIGPFEHICGRGKNPRNEKTVR